MMPVADAAGAASFVVSSWLLVRRPRSEKLTLNRCQGTLFAVQLLVPAGDDIPWTFGLHNGENLIMAVTNGELYTKRLMPFLQNPVWLLRAVIERRLNGK
jgi:hypothetical protein